MSCVDCEYGNRMHEEVKTDLSIVNCIVHSITHGYINLAIEEATKMQHRLEKRNLAVTGREIC